ncbi:extracellular solute-binding protein [Amnibacterium sp. CER49]|uniref:ABC transporter substrate-binding protein n=1 Tax=Amnibacterium sp. CER49 TaxID=3039161 RepID=UPI002448363A|nr:extracellular solute-binding protein [Amnibacterium sp. CER49]MDH2444048.1 extracellular solute-binding protein [Amnibacterium sp. CER49]
MSTSNTALSRRAFAGLAGGSLASLALAACSSGGGSGSSGGTIQFWNMPWGGTAFNPLDQRITLAYKPKSGLPAVKYQAIAWSNFVAKFSTSVASHTNPAVSSGGGTQAFQFAKQGAIAYADDLLSSWKSNGLYDDFLPGTLEAMKTEQGTVAIPYNIDMRIHWYSKSLLQKAGVQPPTDWQSFESACAALKKIGVYGLGLSGGSGGNAFQGIVGWMINNGGGIFDQSHKPNLVTPENIETLTFLQGLIRNGYADPRSTGYTTQNTQDQWKAGKFGMQVEGPGLASNLGGRWATDVVVGEPLTSASGKKGALFFPNNIMLYKNSSSLKGAEAFLTYYYKAMKPLWTKHTGIGLPVLKSIAATPEFKQDPNAVKCVEAWQPICRTWAAPGGQALFANVSLVDSTTPMTVFGQDVMSLKETPKGALTKLQNTLMQNLKG